YHDASIYVEILRLSFVLKSIKRCSLQDVFACVVGIAMCSKRFINFLVQNFITSMGDSQSIGCTL
ncbi:hypothetical protein ACHAXS_004237, partial [Conticribra weissflogii]